MINDLIATYEIIENKMVISLTWSSMNDVYNYEVYLKDNTVDEKQYKLVKSIKKDKVDLEKDKKVKSKIEIDISELKKIDVSLYVVGLDETGQSKNSNVVNIKHKFEEEKEELVLTAKLDSENKKINLSWNNISDSTYNVYVKDISAQNEEFVLYKEGLSKLKYSIDIQGEEVNLEVYVVAVSDGNEKARSDIKVFK
ncbi:MAG: hypothetical protein ACRDD7_04320 [Peptostreptococcaceae bacterium]